MTRILFVCLGNICRSPAAEGVFRALAPEADTDSAGTGHWHVGDPPYPPMVRAASARGYDLSDLRARQFHAGDFETFDLIIAMDAQNLQDIEALRPGGDITPVHLMTDYAPELGLDHVPDPYYAQDQNGAYDMVLDLLETAGMGLKAAI
ncbi:low molecular weight protein-tyrosine-phosphatase [Roseovarius sp. 2305UL8-3]|uniref:low molecular weight protein-tyrosine-phosphatase n=1 Tax=Roseovarius conchicola TaxID=3121636 RepID=UPI0035289E29